MPQPMHGEVIQQTTAPKQAIAVTEGRGLTARVVQPAPGMVQLEKHRPIMRVSTNPGAGVDVTLCRPLGYRCKAITFLAPGSLFKTTMNTDSVYIDIEDATLSTAATPAALNMVELPAGMWLTLEEVDPGWIHWTSPTANQRLMWWAGGPSGMSA